MRSDDQNRGQHGDDYLTWPATTAIGAFVGMLGGGPYGARHMVFWNNYDRACFAWEGYGFDLLGARLFFVACVVIGLLVGLAIEYKVTITRRK